MDYERELREDPLLMYDDAGPLFRSGIESRPGYVFWVWTYTGPPSRYGTAHARRDHFIPTEEVILGILARKGLCEW